jgi:hypothetical protein
MRKTSLALIACLTLAHAVPARAASVSTQSLAAPSAETATPRPRVIRIPRTASTPTLSEEERYAVREAISKEAKNFRGGDAIVITATAAIIILLGVIIIILLV